MRSVDLGSLRLTAALLPSDPPAPAEIEAARAAVRDAFAAIVPPRPETALATGGSARASRGRRAQYGPAELERVVGPRQPARGRDRRELGLAPDRARTLLAGALVLAEVSRLLGVAVPPSRGGIREGAAFGSPRAQRAA